MEVTVDVGLAKAFTVSEIEMSSQNKGVVRITFSPSSSLSNFKGTIKLTATEIFDSLNCPNPQTK